METHVTNTCICYYCETCEMVSQYDDYEDYEDTCYECGGPIKHTPCIGCYDDMLDRLDDTLAVWRDRRSGQNGYIIEGADMGWRRRSGSKWVPDADAKTLVEAIGPDTEWSQEWKVNANTIRVTQSHHDAMGETYKVRSATPREYDYWTN